MVGIFAVFVVKSFVRIRHETNDYWVSAQKSQNIIGNRSMHMETCNMSSNVFYVFCDKYVMQEFLVVLSIDNQ